MAILTWKNVEAPDLGQSGALLNTATKGFMQAMNNLGSLAEGARTRRRDTASAQALMGSIGLKSPEELAQYVRGLDARNLNTDAVQEFLKMPSSLVRLQNDEVNLQDARDDLSYQTNTRQRDAAVQAAADAVSGQVTGLLAAAANGDNTAMTRLAELGQAQPLAGGLIAEAIGTSQDNLKGFQDRRDTEYKFGEQYENDRFAEQSLDSLEGLRQQYATADDARNAVIRDESIPAELKQVILGDIEQNASSFGTRSSEDIDLLNDFGETRTGWMQGFDPFEGDRSTMADNRKELEYASNNIKRELEQSPYARHMDIVSRVNADIEDKGNPDYAKYLTEQLNIDSGWMFSGLAGGSSSSIESFLTEMHNETKLPKSEIAAAIIENVTYGNTIGSGKGTRIIDANNLKETLKYILDPGSVREEINTITDRRNERDSLDQSIAASDALREKINFHYNNGNTDAAYKALSQLRQNEGKIGKSLSEINGRYVARDRRSAERARGETVGPSLPKGPLSQANQEAQGLVLNRFGDVGQAAMNQQLDAAIQEELLRSQGLFGDLNRYGNIR